MTQPFNLQRLCVPSDEARRTARHELTLSMIRVGFTRLVDHGVDSALVERVRWITSQLYTLPEAVLLACDGRPFDVQRGYGPIGTEAYEGQKLELKRMFSVGDYPGEHPLYGSYPLFWPLDPADLVEVMRLYDALLEIAILLTRAIVIDLGLPPDDFMRPSERTDSVFRLLENPALPEDATTASFCRNNRHVDSGMLTVMVPATVPGLVVEGSDGVARQFGCEGGELVVNTGRLLELMLAARRAEIDRERFPVLPTARPHWVEIVPGHTGARNSFPFFLWPDPHRPIGDGRCAWEHLRDELTRHKTRQQVRVSS